MIRALMGLLLIVVWQCWAVAPSLRVERYGGEDGLPQNSIVTVAQDQQGFMWIATMDGLSRFDGYHFKSFEHDKDDPTSLAGNYISALLVDDAGFVWVGTRFNGLNRYDPATESFQRFGPHLASNQGLLSNNISSLVLGENNHIWIGSDKGLSRFDSNTGLFAHYALDAVNSLLVDSDGRLWVVFDTSLGYFDANTEQLVKVDALDTYISKQAPRRSVGELFEDEQQRLWFGYLDDERSALLLLNRQTLQLQPYSVALSDDTDAFFAATITQDDLGYLWLGSGVDGLRRFDVDNNQVLRFAHDETDVTSLSDNRVYSFFKDRNGLHWIGTKFGLNKVDFSLLRMGHYKASKMIEFSMSQSIVMSILKDKQNVLWVATDGGGVNYQQNRFGPFKYLRHDKLDDNSLSHDVVLHMFADESGDLWFGTLQGLNHYRPSTGKMTRYLHRPELVQNLREMQITRVLAAESGYLWLGTGAGVLKFNMATGEVERLKLKQTDIDIVYSLVVDGENNLWIGEQTRGLVKVNLSTMDATRYRKQTTQSGSLSHDSVLSLYVDSQGILWAGTYDGLNRYDAYHDDFTVFDKRHGLLDELIYAITEDKEGHLWVSTNSGLAKLDVGAKLGDGAKENAERQLFSTLQVYDGLQSNEFNVYAAFTADDGELFFGGVNGFNRFYSQQIKQATLAPRVILSDFLVANRSAQISSDKSGDIYQLARSISVLDELTVGANQKLIAFEFTADDYHFPQLNQFRYRLTGFDQSWLYTNAENHRATYTNLPAGEYLFEVSAANRYQQWSVQPRQVKLIVEGPMWLSWWAKSLYVLLFIAMMWWLNLYFAQRSKMKQQQLVVAHLQQVDKLKDAFLATTSHELRSPISGIVGLTEALLNGSGGKLPIKVEEQLSTVVAAGRRLTHLINDILDMSKLKHGQIKLNVTKVNLYLVCQEVIKQTKPLIASKSILLTNLIDPRLAAVNADEQRLTQVIFNLVSNAIKFTESGTVTIDARPNSDGVELRVIDTGVGINAESLTKIFDPFEQESKRSGFFEGSGLGLTISRQLVALHGGELVVSSELNQGSCFKFTLPSNIPDKTLEITEQVDSQLEQQSMNLALLSAGEENSVTFSQLALSEFDGSQFRLLIVDDDPINIKLITQHLSLHKYQISSAISGAQALEVIENQGPFDLVLLDILMPQMSGFELCREVRREYSMSELPVIFLTASYDQQDVVKGLLAGGNDHLRKPVDQYELLARVSTHIKLLDIRRNLERKVAERSEQIVAAQQKLVFTEKLASLGTLMAGVAHEINNPINFMALSLSGLKTDLDSCKKELVALAGGDNAPKEVLTMLDDNFAPIVEHLSTLDEGAERVRTIVKDLKSASYMDVSASSSVDLVASLNSNINLIASEYGRKVTFKREFEPLPRLTCFIAKLNQVFMNIMVNACDAIDVKIEQDADFIGELIVRSYVEDEQVIVLEFADNGCGMDEKIKKRLFDPFFTTKGFEKGTGLGLSISIDIVRSHQGQLLVESELGVGTTFTVKLPL